MRVLVVEDEFLVGVQLEEDLRAAGHEVIGPFASLETALAASHAEPFDLALLDVNLSGTMVFPLADELLDRNIPFIFLSGYIAADLPARFRGARQISKPHDPRLLIRDIAALDATKDALSG